ncbi:MAG: SUMF1/EgtB/PvdO family nonheme iron enzyme [Nitrospinae bacterium]|nr:SUMF1/EgtB/PvdO family nonheme iron enzyme [Nitrospinota bacterium]
MNEKKYTVLLALCLSISQPACQGEKLPATMVSEIDRKAMVLVPAGEFVMGTNKTDPENIHLRIGTVKPLYVDQQPERKVFLDAYYIDRFEVTNKEYKRFVDSAQYPDCPANWVDGEYPRGLDDHPVTNVSWAQAMAYALWAHKTLPTEAQWEKAARGADGRIYPWGNEYAKGQANIEIDAVRQTAPVGSYPRDVSPYQAYDMSGNVMEWTQDWYQAYPGNDYQSSRFGKNFKVLRGNGYQKAGHYFLEAYRYLFHRTEAEPDEFFENVGFRCATPFIKPGGN